MIYTIEKLLEYYNACCIRKLIDQGSIYITMRENQVMQ